MLFEDSCPTKARASSYDVLGRFNYWQGGRNANDAMPVDECGAWRETWFTFFASREAGDSF